MSDAKRETIVSRPTIDPGEFASEGWVQEINRRFLHPVGLALGYTPGEPGFVVFDGRDDPEGVTFGFRSNEEKEEARRKAENVDRIMNERVQGRMALGYFVQPLPE